MDLLVDLYLKTLEHFEGLTAMEDCLKRARLVDLYLKTLEHLEGLTVMEDCLKKVRAKLMQQIPWGPAETIEQAGILAQMEWSQST